LRSLSIVFSDLSFILWALHAFNIHFMILQIFDSNGKTIIMITNQTEIATSHCNHGEAIFGPIVAIGMKSKNTFVIVLFTV
jgi:hypothetical protein